MPARPRREARERERGEESPALPLKDCDCWTATAGLRLPCRSRAYLLWQVRQRFEFWFDLMRNG